MFTQRALAARRLARPATPLAAAPCRPFHATTAAMTVHTIESKEAFHAAIKSHKRVLLDASASWCGPCKVISPIFERLSAVEGNGDVFFAKFDVDEVPDLAQELGIRAMPSFFAFVDGEKTGDMLGANPPALEKLVASTVAA